MRQLEKDKPQVYQILLCKGLVGSRWMNELTGTAQPPGVSNDTQWLRYSPQSLKVIRLEIAELWLLICHRVRNVQVALKVFLEVCVI